MSPNPTLVSSFREPEVTDRPKSLHSQLSSPPFSYLTEPSFKLMRRIQCIAKHGGVLNIPLRGTYSQIRRFSFLFLQVIEKTVTKTSVFPTLITSQTTREISLRCVFNSQTSTKSYSSFDTCVEDFVISWLSSHRSKKLPHKK